MFSHHEEHVIGFAAERLQGAKNTGHEVIHCWAMYYDDLSALTLIFLIFNHWGTVSDSARLKCEYGMFIAYKNLHVK